MMGIAEKIIQQQDQEPLFMSNKLPLEALEQAHKVLNEAAIESDPTRIKDATEAVLVNTGKILKAYQQNDTPGIHDVINRFCNMVDNYSVGNEGLEKTGFPETQRMLYLTGLDDATKPLDPLPLAERTQGIPPDQQAASAPALCELGNKSYAIAQSAIMQEVLRQRQLKQGQSTTAHLT